ncbi:MAG: hypothetical protein Q4F83_11180 [Eubacteriales bacterium]|nr:hypothetical protein [Eubacteriales bacterium]
MADLQSLLGESFKEGMTLDEINEALASREFMDKSELSGYVPKSMFDKASTEAADYKKKWRGALSEADQKAQDELEKQTAMENELKKLRRESAISGYEKNYISLGYDEKSAKEVAEAMYDGDMETVFRIQKKQQDDFAKATESRLMKNMSNAPSGNQVDVDYSKQIAEAQASGNMVLAAALIRQQADANKNKK